jgi:hypothetical protein
MTRIDWFRITGEKRDSDDKLTPTPVPSPPPTDPVAWVTQTPAADSAGLKISTFWPLAIDLPNIHDLKFGKATVQTIDIPSLMASSWGLKKENLIWHLQNPGVRRQVSPFTIVDGQPMPLVATGVMDGLIIADGHHYLAAMLLTGTTSCQAVVIPTP